MNARESRLRMPAETRKAASTRSISWPRIAYIKMVETRHERIATAAYLMAEARGFDPGHAADDWYGAQIAIDSQESGLR